MAAETWNESWNEIWDRWQSAERRITDLKAERDAARMMLSQIKDYCEYRKDHSQMVRDILAQMKAEKDGK